MDYFYSFHNIFQCLMDMNALDLEEYYQNREKIPDLIVETAFLSTTCLAAQTVCNMSCTFDADFCEWEQAINDNFDWIRNKGPTQSPNTGPPHDHTTGGRNRKCSLVVLQIQQSLGRVRRTYFSRKSRQHVSWALSELCAAVRNWSWGEWTVQHIYEYVMCVTYVCRFSCRKASAKMYPGWHWIISKPAHTSTG